MRSLRRVTTLGIVSAMVWALAALCFAGAAAANVDYLSASFVNESHGWIAGIDDATYRTEVWRTVDGGQTWAKTGSSLAAGGGVGWVVFVSESTGVWGNGSLLRTTDGGGIWTPATVVGDLGIANEATFAGENHGWAACSYGSSESGGAIAATTDGGASWSLQKDLAGPDGSGGVSRVSSPTEQRCYALKWGKNAGVWATADGGASWARRALPAIPGPFARYRDIDFTAGRTGWAVGDAGRIVKTVDGGVTWVRQSLGVATGLTAVDFVSTSVGFAAGKGGCLLRTVNGGAHWIRLNVGTNKRLEAVCFVDRTHGWLVGANGVRLRTVNGGRTWVGQR
jgi:photosystem II stability/assembly factor-like uncharacterized protein